MPTVLQFLIAALATLAFGAMALLAPGALGSFLILTGAVGFLTIAVWRTFLILASAALPAVPPDPAVWPRYTVIAALHDEADVVDQLIGRLARLDFPADRLQGLLLLEAGDIGTRAAALATPRPDWLEIVVVPPGEPRTKPRALNCGLAHATGELIVVYDAEDEPHPGQLREAAARFAADTTGKLACLQAPLRVRPGTSPFLDRQFAAEYAGLFEATLPGMARLGLPFPLGGTSNHFRGAALRQVGGWDAWNVTEDADMGFRLWEHGWRMGVITRPTTESPPGSLADWLPQRTRWLKGYMQTWGVHTREPWRLGFKGWAAFVLSIGAGLAAAALTGPSLAWVAATVLVALVAGLPPEPSALAGSVLILGAASAWLSCAIGARRAGVTYGPLEMMAAPAYWALLSLAFGHALWRLILCPFIWDKTRHHPDAPTAEPATVQAGQQRLDAAGGLRLSAVHAPAPELVA